MASWAKVSRSCRWEIDGRERKENISPSAETKHRPRVFELVPFCTVLAVGRRTVVAKAWVVNERLSRVAAWPFCGD